MNAFVVHSHFSSLGSALVLLVLSSKYQAFFQSVVIVLLFVQLLGKR